MKIFALSDFHGDFKVLRKMRGVIDKMAPDIVLYCGDVVKGRKRKEAWMERQAKAPETEISYNDIVEAQMKEDVEIYERFFSWLNDLYIPVKMVPGNLDAPEGLFLKSILKGNKYENINLVHRSFATAGRDFCVIGFGGEVTEDERETELMLRYPQWELESALSITENIPQNALFLFHTPPSGGKLDKDGRDFLGSEAIRKTIEEWKPLYAFCGHAHDSQGFDTIGESLVINPGAMRRKGHYAMLDTRREELVLDKAV